MIDLLLYAAPALTILAALMTAANLGSRVTGWGFVVFTVGSIAWLVVGLVKGPPSLAWQNVVLLLLNLFGVWRWLGRQRRLEEGADHASRRSRAAPVEMLFPLRMTNGAAVVDEAGTELGKTVEAMAACADGRLAYLVVSSGGVGGVGETLRRLKFDQVAVDGDRFRFAGTAQQFEALAAVDGDAWPAR